MERKYLLFCLLACLLIPAYSLPTDVSPIQEIKSNLSALWNEMSSLKQVVQSHIGEWPTGIQTQDGGKEGEYLAAQQPETLYNLGDNELIKDHHHDHHHDHDGKEHEHHHQHHHHHNHHDEDKHHRSHHHCLGHDHGMNDENHHHHHHHHHDKHHHHKNKDPEQDEGASEGFELENHAQQSLEDQIMELEDGEETDDKEESDQNENNSECQDEDHDHHHHEEKDHHHSSHHLGEGHHHHHHHDDDNKDHGHHYHHHGKDHGNHQHHHEDHGKNHGHHHHRHHHHHDHDDKDHEHHHHHDHDEKYHGHHHHDKDHGHHDHDHDDKDHGHHHHHHHLNHDDKDHGHHHHHEHHAESEHHDDHHHHEHHAESEHHDDHHHDILEAECHVEPNAESLNSEVTGEVLISQMANFTGPLQFDIYLTGIPNASGAPKKIGFHIHQDEVVDGKCSSAGPHFNPEVVTHGGPDDKIRHVGDLGNVEVDENGEVLTLFKDDKAKFEGYASILGRSIVVHSMEDDLGLGGDEGSLATGNAGPRLACCNIISRNIPEEQKGVRTVVRFNG